MTRRDRRPLIRLPGCGTLLGCLTIVAAAVWVIVRTVTLWVTGHPWLVIAVLAAMAGAGTLGGRAAARRAPPPDDEPPDT